MLKRRIKALKKLQFSYMKEKAEYYKDLYALGKKYANLFSDIYEKQRLIVSSEVEPTDEECNCLSKEKDKDQEVVEDEKELKSAEDLIRGIPNFWLTVLKNINGPEMIHKCDEAILSHLTDIRSIHKTDSMGFILQFFFEPNDYFTNEILTKEYGMDCEPEERTPFSFEGPAIVSTKGCFIDWKIGENITIKNARIHQNTKFGWNLTWKTVNNDSFFNFFSPPGPLEKKEDEDWMDSQTIIDLTNDYRLGYFISRYVIPKAVYFFTGEGRGLDLYRTESEDDEDEETDVYRKIILNDKYNYDEDDDDDDGKDWEDCELGHTDEEDSGEAMNKVDKEEREDKKDFQETDVNESNTLENQTAGIDKSKDCEEGENKDGLCEKENEVVDDCEGDKTKNEADKEIKVITSPVKGDGK